MVGDRAGRCRLRRSDHAIFIALGCNNRGGNVAGLRWCSKNDFTRHLTPHMLYPLHHEIWQLYLK
jgi:hypothetical protein